MDAVFNINKPPGMTSFAAVARVRRLLNIKKAGHAGTLDPMATGVLLVLSGKATRLSQFLMGRPKEYLATVKLGIETDTCDLEGQVVRQCDVPELDHEALLRILSEFTGQIKQRPPVFSAVKINGQEAYKKARQGQKVEMPERLVQIDFIELLELARDEIQIKVKCSKGTYIRSLARDIGNSLNSCATLSSLGRTAVGDFRLEQASDLDSITVNDGIPMDKALSFLPEAIIDDENSRKVKHGNTIVIDEKGKEDIFYRIKYGGELVALGKFIADNKIHPEIVL
jgi:tRNA pseudouridine55 synthase